MSEQQLSQNEARQALEQAGRPAIATRKDRWVYGGGTAAFGVLMGCWCAWTEPRYGRGGTNLTIVLAFCLMLAGLGYWQTRAMAATPRRAKMTAYIGLALMVLVMGVGTVIIRTWTPGSPPAWAMAVYGIAIALPMLVTGALIVRRAR